MNEGAVCNDGTPAGFYWRKGTGSGVNQYVIHLQVINFKQRFTNEKNLIFSL